MDYPAPAQPLVDMTHDHPFFIGVDSDGCVFDTMELKHKECFTPNIIRYWDLQSVSKYARECSEWVNLYSKFRGINRWPAVIKVFDLLRERPEVIRRGVTPPTAEQLRAFIEDDAYPKSNDGLKAYMESHSAPELDTGLAWTRAVNDTVAAFVHNIPPFPYVRESFEHLSDKADMIVVSATPVGALKNEWTGNNLAQYMKVIAGQEMGKKSLHLKLATEGHYAPDHVLMMGDAPGDMRAAQANNALFYPINPGQEEASWQRFHEEGMHKFLAGEFAGAYQQSLIDEFEKMLPDTPTWSTV